MEDIDSLMERWPINTTAASLSNNLTDNDTAGLQMALYDTRRFQYYAWGVIGSIISVLGVLGNFLSIIVLSNKRMKSSTSYYLIMQAIYDSMVLVSLILFMSLPAIYYETRSPALHAYMMFFAYLNPIGYPIALTVQTCAIYTTVGFTVERFIAVCYPLRAAKMCTIQRARKSLLIITLCSMVYNIPRWLEYRTVEYWDPDTNTTDANYEYTALGMNHTFRHIYFIYMHMSFMLLIPFLVVLVMNIMLVRAVRRSAKADGKVSKKQKRENNLTIMLISVVVVFLICQVPSIFDNIFGVTLDEGVMNTKPFIVLTCLSSLMVVSNSAANFYLYCVFGQKFRHIFVLIFCTCFKSVTQRVLGYTPCGHREFTQQTSTAPHSEGGSSPYASHASHASHPPHHCHRSGPFHGSSPYQGKRNGDTLCMASTVPLTKGSRYSIVRQNSYGNVTNV